MNRSTKTTDANEELLRLKIPPQILWSVAAGFAAGLIAYFVAPSKLDADGDHGRLWIGLGAGLACAATGIVVALMSRSSNGDAQNWK